MTMFLIVVCIVLLSTNAILAIHRYEFSHGFDEALVDAILLLDIDTAHMVLDTSDVETVDVDELHHSARAVLLYIAERERFIPDTYPEAVAVELLHRMLLDLAATSGVYRSAA
jgi:hypothetical protein